ncbi:MAG TPA: IPTL-CTERM sorting domain-containing protein [Thermoanaerobaculia bacterium]|nr:IPTL-CTERM sorting domain-containing protein [Thermoanaerobaculia bacterium]
MIARTHLFRALVLAALFSLLGSATVGARCYCQFECIPFGFGNLCVENATDCALAATLLCRLRPVAFANCNNRCPFNEFGEYCLGGCSDNTSFALKATVPMNCAQDAFDLCQQRQADVSSLNLTSNTLPIPTLNPWGLGALALALAGAAWAALRRRQRQGETA